MPEHTLYRPWGTVTPAFWSTGHEPSGLTAEAIRARLSEIASAAESGRIPHAVELAERLDADVTRELGEIHLHTVLTREVRGYLAALSGDHARGLSWYLHSARLRATVQGTTHPEVDQALRRSYSLWQSTPPAADRHRLGTELLTAVRDIHGPDVPLARHIREQLDTLALPPAPHREPAP